MCGEWRDIETAPEYEDEAPRVLLWVADGRPNGKGKVSFGHVYRYPDYFRAVAEGYHGEWNITHWMPIPDGPNPAGGSP